MSKPEPKILLPHDALASKVEEVLSSYKGGPKDPQALYKLIDNLIFTYNQTVQPMNEMTWMTMFQACYPDH